MAASVGGVLKLPQSQVLTTRPSHRPLAPRKVAKPLSADKPAPEKTINCGELDTVIPKRETLTLDDGKEERAVAG